MQVRGPRFLSRRLSGLSEVQAAVTHKESLLRTTALPCTHGSGSSFTLYVLQRRWTKSFVGCGPIDVSAEAPRGFWMQKESLLNSVWRLCCIFALVRKATRFLGSQLCTDYEVVTGALCKKSISSQRCQNLSIMCCFWTTLNTNDNNKTNRETTVYTRTRNSIM